MYEQLFDGSEIFKMPPQRTDNRRALFGSVPVLQQMHAQASLFRLGSSGSQRGLFELPGTKALHVEKPLAFPEEECGPWARRGRRDGVIVELDGFMLHIKGIATDRLLLVECTRMQSTGLYIPYGILKCSPGAFCTTHLNWQFS